MTQRKKNLRSRRHISVQITTPSPLTCPYIYAPRPTEPTNETFKDAPKHEISVPRGLNSRVETGSTGAVQWCCYRRSGRTDRIHRCSSKSKNMKLFNGLHASNVHTNKQTPSAERSQFIGKTPNALFSPELDIRGPTHPTRPSRKIPEPQLTVPPPRVLNLSAASSTRRR